MIINLSAKYKYIARLKITDDFQFFSTLENLIKFWLLFALILF